MLGPLPVEVPVNDGASGACTELAIPMARSPPIDSKWRMAPPWLSHGGSSPQAAQSPVVKAAPASCAPAPLWRLGADGAECMHDRAGARPGQAVLVGMDAWASRAWTSVCSATAACLGEI